MNDEQQTKVLVAREIMEGLIWIALIAAFACVFIWG